MEKRIAVLQAIVEKVLDVLPTGSPAPAPTQAPAGPEATAVTARPATGARGDSEGAEAPPPPAASSISERVSGSLTRARDVFLRMRAPEKRSLEL